MTRKMGPTPEERERWAETKRLVQERVDWHGARKRERYERDDRRRRRLRRLSLGLLGRS